MVIALLYTISACKRLHINVLLLDSGETCTMISVVWSGAGVLVYFKSHTGNSDVHPGLRTTEVYPVLSQYVT